MSTLLPSVPALAGSLLSAALEGTVITAVLSLLLRMVPGLSARVRSRIWIGMFAIACVLPVPAWFRSGIPAAHSGLHVRPVWAYALVALWAAVAMVRAAQLLASGIRLRGIARRATPVATPDLPVLEKISVCTSAEVDVPSVIGFRRPRILLPPYLLEQLPPEELRQILLHEQAHILRHDQWTNLLQKSALVLFPLNPVLHWIERRLCLERELACDDVVLHVSGTRKAYAVCLANLAEHTLLRRGVSLALGAWGRQSELSRRVHRILKKPQAELSPAKSCAVAALSFSAVLCAAAMLSQAPEPVTFSSPAVSFASAAAPNSVLPAPVRPASATLVAAHVPGAAAASRKLPTIRRASQHIARRARQQPAPYLLVGWQPEDRAGRVRLVTLTDSDFTYAAVPVRDGWLIVQL